MPSERGRTDALEPSEQIGEIPNLRRRNLPLYVSSEDGVS